MNKPSVRLRPVTEEDLPLLERFCVEPELMGLAWRGFCDRGKIRHRFAEDAFLGKTDGRLMVSADGHTAGFVEWRAFTYNTDENACWNIGIGVLPEWRGCGIGGEAQRQLADYLLTHTPKVRIEATTALENVAEQRALERAGFTREGTLRRIAFSRGSWRDCVLYSRVRTDPMIPRHT